MNQPNSTVWKRIRRTGQQLAQGFEPERSADGDLRIRVEVTLEPVPPKGWFDSFMRQRPQDLTTFSRAQWDHKITIHLDTTEKSMGQDMSRLDAAIDRTNRAYESEVLPAVHREQREKDDLTDLARRVAAIPPAPKRD